MEPLTGFAVYLGLALLVGVIAGKRGRRGWAYTLVVLALGPVAVILATMTGASRTGAAWSGFLVPIVGAIVALSVRSGDQVAAEEGSYMGKRKCPHCAESIKAEALVCKHCGRDVGARG